MATAEATGGAGVLGPPAATVAIPTFDGAKRIGQLLTALAAQSVESGAAFEVVVVDNASTDDTGRIAREHPATGELCRHGVPLRVVHEGRPGLTYARIRGVLEATAPVVCFLDDDTIPGERYVQDGIQVFSDPKVGVAVSHVFPDYESSPPPAIARREHLFGINRHLGVSPRVWKPEDGIAPTLGAGLWVRREAFLNAVPWSEPEQLLPDRLGETLLSGGDIEIGFLIGRAGHLRTYRPELRLAHRVLARRFDTQYVCRLIVGIMRSAATLDRKYARRGQERAPGRATSLARLLFAVAASPVIAAVRRDGARDALFTLAAAWAGVQGPYHLRVRAARGGRS